MADDQAKGWRPVSVHRSGRGRLSVVESGAACPFAIHRVFCITEVPAGGERANHAHRTTAELLMVAAGSVRAVLDDGRRRETYDLTPDSPALYVPPMTWITLAGFGAGTVLVVAASNPYDADGYIVSYDDYRAEMLAAG